ncbi:hypothetical protein Trydic_g4765 [Trypoxylus dichotomus]
MAATEAFRPVPTQVRGTKKIRDRTDKLTFPKLPANKMLGSYLEYKNSKKTTLPPLQWDTPPVSHNLNYFRVKTELETFIREANKMRRTIPHSTAHFRKRWEQQQAVAEDFKRLIEVCDDFVMNNEEKRRRFKQKMLQSRQAAVLQVQQTESLRKRMNFVKDIKERMEEKVKGYEMYPDFLTAVARQNSLQFKNAEEVVRRFEALYIARHAIAKEEERHERILREAQEELQKLIDEKFAKQNELVVVQDSITRRYNKAKITTIRVENLIANIDTEDHLRRQENFLVKQSCWNVYHHMWNRKFTSVEVQRDDFIGQLKEINKVLGIFSMVFTKLNIPFDNNWIDRRK